MLTTNIAEAVIKNGGLGFFKTETEIKNKESAMSKKNQIKVEITRNTVAGKKSVFIGDTPTLPANEAQYLINIGRAKPFESDKSAKEAKEAQKALANKKAANKKASDEARAEKLAQGRARRESAAGNAGKNEPDLFAGIEHKIEGLNADEAISNIALIEDIDYLEHIVDNDTRKTVIKAATARIEEIKAADENESGSDE